MVVTVLGAAEVRQKWGGGGVVEGTLEGSLESESLLCVKGGANASRLSSETKAGQAG